MEFSNVPNKPLVGISSCLLGQHVRYDGKHKFNPLVAEFIAPHVTLQGLCPESMAGLGIPRPPVNLVITDHGIAAQSRQKPRFDVTDRLIQMAHVVTHALPHLCGYIVQSRSPSCGFQSTPIYDEHQEIILDPAGNGLYIEQIHRLWPQLPIINESELTLDTAQRFINQIKTYAAHYVDR